MAKGESRKNAAPDRPGSSPKQAALDQFRVSADGAHLTTDQGLRINDDQNSLKQATEGRRSSRTSSSARRSPISITSDEAIVVGTDAQLESIAQAFIKAIARHRNWSREAKAQQVPA